MCPERSPAPRPSPTRSGAPHLLAASTVLPSGYTQRMQRLGDALHDAVPAAGRVRTAAVERVQHAFARLEEHRTAHATSTAESRTGTARMAVRLLRWLAVPAEPAPATLYDAVNRQVRDDAWVDRARLDVFAGSTDQPVAAAYSLLHRTVDARRAEHDEQFARLLAAGHRRRRRARRAAARRGRTRPGRGAAAAPAPAGAAAGPGRDEYRRDPPNSPSRCCAPAPVPAGGN